MLHHVKDLSPEQRHTAEILLGHHLSDHESVSITSVTALSIIPSPLSQEQRREALRAFDRYFEKVDAGRRDMSKTQEEGLIAEALRSVRPTYRPID